MREKRYVWRGKERRNKGEGGERERKKNKEWRNEKNMKKRWINERKIRKERWMEKGWLDGEREKTGRKDK